MDLRQYNLTSAQLEAVKSFIVQRKLAYQPFVFSDNLEVGEGLKFHDGESLGGNVHWEGADLSVSDLLVSEEALPHFRDCNDQLRRIYDHMVNSLVDALGDISTLSFAEVGCNTGYFLHSLALRGAARCTGFDFTNNDRVFAWFNQLLGTRSEFHFAEWDSLRHVLQYADVPVVDVCLSIAVTCHLPDPLHHITYLCERARKAVFVWCPVNADSRPSISFGMPAKYPNALDWPVSCDNDVRMSVPLMTLCLEQCGFERIVGLTPPELSPRWLGWWRSQHGIIAFRTRESRTALGSGRNRRDLPSDAPLRLEGSAARTR